MTTRLSLTAAASLLLALPALGAPAHQIVTGTGSSDALTWQVDHLVLRGRLAGVKRPNAYFESRAAEQLARDTSMAELDTQRFKGEGTPHYRTVRDVDLVFVTDQLVTVRETWLYGRENGTREEIRRSGIATTYDLNTGEPFELADVFRPDALDQVDRLVCARVTADHPMHPLAGNDSLRPFLSSFGLTKTGVVFLLPRLSIPLTFAELGDSLNWNGPAAGHFPTSSASRGLAPLPLLGNRTSTYLDRLGAEVEQAVEAMTDEQLSQLGGAQAEWQHAHDVNALLSLIGKAGLTDVQSMLGAAVKRARGSLRSTDLIEIKPTEVSRVRLALHDGVSETQPSADASPQADSEPEKPGGIVGELGTRGEAR